MYIHKCFACKSSVELRRRTCKDLNAKIFVKIMDLFNEFPLTYLPGIL